MMWPALALLLLAGGTLGTPTHALVPSDDGPPSVLRTNDAQHPRQHTAISALLPNDHERQPVQEEIFFCKKTRYRMSGKRVGVFGGVWRFAMANSREGIRFKRSTRSRSWTRWYKLYHVDRPRGNVLNMYPEGGAGDHWKIEMDRMKYNRDDAQDKAETVYVILQSAISWFEQHFGT